MRLSVTHWSQGTALPGGDCVAPRVSCVSLLSFCCLIWTREPIPPPLQVVERMRCLRGTSPYRAFSKHEFPGSSTGDLPHMLLRVIPCLFWKEESALEIYSISLVYLSNKYLLMSYYGPGTLVGAGGSGGKAKRQSPPSCSIYIFIFLTLRLQLGNKHIIKLRPKDYETRQCTGISQR